MLKELGFILGIENYLWIFDGCELGLFLYMFIDYFFDDFVMFVDEFY